jgi:hypothetical protein
VNTPLLLTVPPVVDHVTAVLVEPEMVATIALVASWFTVAVVGLTEMDTAASAGNPIKRQERIRAL